MGEFLYNNCMACKFKIGDLVTSDTSGDNCYWKISEIIETDEETTLEVDIESLTTNENGKKELCTHKITFTRILIKAIVYEIVEEFNRYMWSEGSAYIWDLGVDRLYLCQKYPIQTIQH